MHPNLRSLAATVASVAVALSLGVTVVSAHAGVEPREAPANTNQTYTLRVPNEQPVPTVKIRLEFPPEVTVSRFEQKPGWTREVEKDQSGKIVAVTWSGGQVQAEEFEDFAFVARNPREVGTITFKAYQTYQGGETVAWAGPEGSDRPGSFTKITAAAAGASGTVSIEGANAAAGAGAKPGTAPAPAAQAGAPASATERAAGGGSDLALLAALGSLLVALVALAVSVVAFARRPRASDVGGATAAK